MKRFTQLFAVLLGVGALPGAEVPTVINVEVDYMVGGTHSHEPSQLVLDALVQMFACQGITLNLMVDDVIPHEDVIQCDDRSSGLDSKPLSCPLTRST